MELAGQYLMAFVETGGLFAPVLFIGFHLVRPLFFLPVVFICISGGVLFGAVAGTVYSIIGITLSSLFFYGIIRWMPQTLNKLLSLKQKLLGNHSSFTMPQITLLRLVPFIHFHLLSLCLIETTGGFRDYAKSSFVSNIPLAVVYTTIGQWISQLSPMHIVPLLLVLLPLLYLLRRKEVIIKWNDFFNPAQNEAA
ncbi:TVP38/TMEM64 family membrane protein YtxB [Lentibacillus sp. JNUCC-1]|uniref:TVP38/TMEM64 family protein n=1 Tax=Lentibacillus sp. JNUCC-1 TaxID=2654513 RepID=UPI0012E72559|nr:VTT domain-containing protein [Lentibacillus sp. JNUCC-1]MUV39365.1 TVP38/TMEM64 family membrane protein YtxB [Lentibacillus sp. JNUCC-1]